MRVFMTHWFQRMMDPQEPRPIDYALIAALLLLLGAIVWHAAL